MHAPSSKVRPADGGAKAKRGRLRTLTTVLTGMDRAHLVFDDAAKEAKWRDAHAERYLARLRMGAALTAVMNLLLLVPRAAVEELEEHDSEWNEMPLVLLFPLANFCVGTLVFVRVGWLQRREGVLAGATFFGLLFAMLDTTLGGTSAGEENLWVLMTYSLGICSMTGLPSHLASAVVAVNFFLFAILAWVDEESGSGIAMTCTFALIVFGALLTYLSYSWEKSERRDFLLSDFLEEENQNVQQQMDMTGWFSSGAQAMHETQASLRDVTAPKPASRAASSKVAVGPVDELRGQALRHAVNSSSRTLDVTGSVLSAGCHVAKEELTLAEALGEGSYGQVFKGLYHETTVAVKQLNLPARASDSYERVLRQVGSEAAIMAEIRHPNIVMFMGVCIAADFVAMVMEFCPKGSLYGVLHDRNYQHLHKSLVVRLMVNAAHGMAYLHDHKPTVIHADLKSLNLLVDADWHCKVSDFGLSGVKAASAEASTANHNNPNAIAGSVVWCAPELFLDEPHSEASDVYGFGVVLFEVINHSLPYHKLVQESIPHLVATGKRPDDFEDFKAPEDGDVRMRQLEELARACWAADPAARPAFSEVLHRLQDLAVEVVGDADCTEGVVFPGHRLISMGGAAGGGEGGGGGGGGDGADQQSGFTISSDEVTMGKQIGSGSYAAVFEGTYFGTKVAVKKLFVKGLPEDVLDEFKHECRIMMDLRHPNIVLFMGSCCQMPDLLLVTELMTRGSLYDVYRHHDRPEPVTLQSMAVRVAYDMARGLSYLHNHRPPVIHRDLKSPNIMLDDSLRAKVGDFGFARVKDASKTMSMCGSPLWIAPEIILGEDYDSMCDVFSYSIIVWEVLHWAEPYPGLASRQVMADVSAGTLRPTVRESVPRSLCALMQDCWQQVPAQRPQFADIVARLEGVAEELEVSL